jgi:hypothetical protein
MSTTKLSPLLSEGAVTATAAANRKAISTLDERGGMSSPIEIYREHKDQVPRASQIINIH